MVGAANFVTLESNVLSLVGIQFPQAYYFHHVDSKGLGSAAMRILRKESEHR